MTWVIKISKPTKNVLTVTDERDLIFSSERNCLKETSTTGLYTTNAAGDLTINHALGYVPAFVVFVADNADTSVWYPYDSIGDVYADANNIYIVGAMGGITSRVYCSIFVDEL